MVLWRRTELLSDIKIRKAKPAHKPYKLADGHQLYLYVSPAGGKFWRMNYTFDGKQRTLSIGPYPLIGLAEARTQRDEARRKLMRGQDPGIAKKAEGGNADARAAWTGRTRRSCPTVSPSTGIHRKFQLPRMAETRPSRPFPRPSPQDGSGTSFSR